ncbi:MULTISPECIES: poly-beta-1,6-N-acetyl-D-glucosamine synthase [unclassified Enterobacter]|uniref:poly-beta-1,6-N-acetyl-D-glucosamine synthase n=1 Tax=unclassified Enterobacter TaxID=2608935 RepID=UPI00296EAED4|nr:MULTISPECIES: poly-beta-1,6-N-acetyl-D-glucosamine synthase [unclassified Enterobacter]WJD49300.1 poly-beta-1,6-N-acetyl-D-glucosamine synthase [Enterobacter sp. PGRG2]
MNNRIVSLIILCLVVSIPLVIALLFSVETMLRFVFFWPFFMSVLWMAGGLLFWFSRERHWSWGREDDVPTLKGKPLVSVIVPCYNEENNVAETIESVLNQRYKNIEVIAVDDGSTDGTGFILNRLAKQHLRLRVIHLAHNQGKAIALKTGVAAAKSEWLVCIDGDAKLDRDAVAYIVAPMLENPRVGAVTGNPRIRTRSTLIGKIQVGEFSSIIGMIKRTQRMYGQIFTISGVVAAFRRTALADVGYWSEDIITEDIDISWKLQLKHWSIFYEPRALCWVLMPETLKGLWKQRLRWAQGGAEVFRKNMTRLWQWKNRRMWPLFTEYCLSTAWAFTCVISFILFLASPHGAMTLSNMALDGLAGIILSCICIAQFAVSLLIDSRYEKNLAGALFWVIWFPAIYWVLSLMTTIVAFTRVMIISQNKRARWISPDRGIERG